MGKFLSEFTNLGKDTLCFWAPFWVRGLSEPRRILAGRVPQRQKHGVHLPVPPFLGGKIGVERKIYSSSPHHFTYTIFINLFTNDPKILYQI
ncbi:MAG: hypothetical protein L6416_00200 [Candidatus Omnitrophica bacterium]|nr:hypothetical protein [Candidatus Omnitrophota bacterium]